MNVPIPQQHNIGITYVIQLLPFQSCALLGIGESAQKRFTISPGHVRTMNSSIPLLQTGRAHRKLRFRFRLRCRYSDGVHHDHELLSNHSLHRQSPLGTFGISILSNVQMEFGWTGNRALDKIG